MKSKIEASIDQMNDDFKVFSTIVLKQYVLIKRLFDGAGTAPEGENGGDTKENSTLDEVYKEIESNETLLDGFEVKMREEIVRSIVLYGPRAGDLRKIMAYHDMSSYLERMGDLMLNVGEYALQLRSKSPVLVEIRQRLAKLFSVAEKMSQNAIFAFTCEDNLLARDTILKDNVADDMLAEILEDLIEVPVNQMSQPDLRDVVCMSNMAYNIERMADHATNIAESALFLMEGKDWKHRSIGE